MELRRITATLLVAGCAMFVVMLWALSPSPRLEARDLMLSDVGATKGGAKPPPLNRRMPIPADPVEKKINDEVDAEICAAYRRWRAKGNRPTEHIEPWCSTGE